MAPRKAGPKIRLVGVDENGLGPRLGPLIATAVSLEVPRYGEAEAEELAARGRALGIDDSKSSSGFGKMRAAESLSLALAEAEAGGEPVREIEQLLGLLTLEGPLELRAPCPRKSAPQCFSVPLSLPLFGGSAEEGAVMLAGLEEAGIRLRRARSSVVCAGRLNAELSTLGTKLAIDLDRFERLLADAHSAYGSEIRAICGMVGGIRKYSGRFRHTPVEKVELIEERRGGSSYRLEGLGEVSFEVGADKRHLPVSMASMLGKYVRELWMERQNRFYRERDPTLPAASGYHDPITRAQIEGSAKLRRRLGVADACYLRRK